MVNYKENVETSLEMAGLNPEEYTYAFVSGLPEIKFPVAVIFGEEAEFIIPAEEATTHVFGDDVGAFGIYEFKKSCGSS